MGEQGPGEPEREGTGDKQHDGRIVLRLITQDAGNAEAQGHRGAKQDGRLYKSRKQTASGRMQKDLQRHRHGQNRKHLRGDFSVVHVLFFRQLRPLT